MGKELDRSGKVVHQGIAVYGNKGSTDQHAYVQQLREGVNNFFVTFIEVLKDRALGTTGESSELMVEAGVIPCDSLAELFSESDIVIDCEALTPASTRSVTEKILRLLPERGVYVNVARGAIADEAAIARLTAEGRIRAALDVFSTEPLPDDSELLQIENLLLSPHIAGPTGDWLHYCGDFALNNLERYLKGQPLSGVVTLEAYDRTT